jgi:hypothetical protein
MVEPDLYSPIRLHGLMLKYLSIEAILSFYFSKI